MCPDNKDTRRDRSQTLKDVVVFGRVVSTGLLVGGYVFVGVYVSGWLEAEGYPRLLVALAPVAIALFGIWQGWIVLRQIVRKNGNTKK